MALANPQQPRSGHPNLLDLGQAGGIDVGSRIGLSARAVEQLGRIWLQQVRWFVEDQQASARRLGETLDPLGTWLDHVQRRSEHVGSGMQHLLEVGRDASEHASTLSHTLWGSMGVGAALPPGSALPFDTPAGVIARLRRDHRRLEQVLERLQALIEASDPMPVEHLDVLLSGIRYIAQYPDAIHHPLEDRLFAHLLNAPLSDAERTAVQTNAAGHQQIMAATRRLLADVEAVRHEAAPPAATLRDSLRDFIDLQRRHMAFEENTIFPLAEARLTAAAVRDIAAAEARDHDPLFDQRDEYFSALYDYVAGNI